MKATPQGFLGTLYVISIFASWIWGGWDFMNFKLILAKIHLNINISPEIENPWGAAAPPGRRRRRRIPNFWEYGHIFIDFCQDQLKIHEISISKNPRNQNQK